MRIFEKVRYQDGGPNDKGHVIEYKIILKGDKDQTAPKNPNGFERWREISVEQYQKRKKEAYDAYKIFI